MPDLFDFSPRNIPLDGGELHYYPAFLSPADASDLLSLLTRKVAWRQDRIRIAGREMPIPRLNAWYGDPGADYSYSGIQMQTHPWFDELLRVRDMAAECAGEVFNSALLNLYRNGKDSVAWHADDEPELGSAPVIGSVSLGAERRFQLKSRGGGKERFELRPGHGSLLIMAGQTQRNWVHQVPKEPAIASARINITFRRIV